MATRKPASQVPTGLTRKDAKNTKALGLTQAPVPKSTTPENPVVREFGTAFGWKYNTMVEAMRDAGWKLRVEQFPIQVHDLMPTPHDFAQYTWAISRQAERAKEAASTAAKAATVKANGATKATRATRATKAAASTTVPLDESAAAAS